MAVKIKATSAVAEKWARVTPGRAKDYEDGIGDPTVDWETPTAAAEPAYDAGVSAAIGRKAFGTGVKEAGTTKWRAKTRAKGVKRWPDGVRVAKPDYEKGFGPYREVIAGLTLPPRGPKGDPANVERVRVITEALHAKRIGG